MHRRQEDLAPILSLHTRGPGTILTFVTRPRPDLEASTLPTASLPTTTPPFRTLGIQRRRGASLTLCPPWVMVSAPPRSWMALLRHMSPVRARTLSSMAYSTLKQPYTPR